MTVWKWRKALKFTSTYLFAVILAHKINWNVSTAASLLVDIQILITFYELTLREKETFAFGSSLKKSLTLSHFNKTIFNDIFNDHVNPNWHEAGHFPPPVLFGSYFVSWFFTKNFGTFLEVKIDINRVNLTPWQAHWVL